ncbi:ABC transporter permease [Protaetiibacter mangrovi]|uniref:ABC transporter permease n=1 Tax=Protaetiibacter mangrovi TaxID=2970926 RepID=A0ABT1ZIA3_9MICO|nr:ABC transporter permease [Protaetiibacter mangrovi]MCS0500449.1 ABC transporter permease [Protaetiibacter mangrovi]TPX03732.1 ABC transporter permease [Schumannella luteola]
MTGFGSALRVEWRKARASRVVAATALLTIAGIATIVLSFRGVAASGDPQLIAKLGEAGAAPGWPGLLAIALQVSAPALLLGITVLHSWLAGREFADGTVTGLYALSVGRGQLASAKLLLGVLVAAGMGVALAAVLLVGGLLLGYGPPATADAAVLARVALLAPFSAVVATPVALAATLGRGLLAGVATGFVLLAGAQVLVVAGAGAWFPVAAPALWALDPASVSGAAVAVALAAGALVAALTALVWRRLQLDR